jgi:hypothetical protein
MKDKNNFRLIRDALNLKPQIIANLANVAESTIFSLHKKDLSLSKWQKYADVLNALAGEKICTTSDIINLNFTPNVIYDRKDKMEKFSLQDLKKIWGNNVCVSNQDYFQPQNPDRIKTEDLVKHGEYFADEESNTLSIPFIEAKACCGNGIMDFDHAIKFKLALSLIDNILNTKVLPEDVKSNRYFFISAEGDSMQPFIESGDALMIDTNMKTIPQHRQILLVEDAGNRKMLREFCYLTGNKYRVRAYNKEYESYDKVSYEYIVNEIFGGSFTILGGLVPISIGRFKYPDVEALSRNVIVPK